MVCSFNKLSFQFDSNLTTYMKYYVITLIQKFRFIFSYIFQKGFSEIKFLNSIITDNSIVLDVGSNVGSFIETVIKANKNVYVYSIEPDENLINHQIKKFQNLKNISYSNIAIDSKNGEATFYLRDPASHSSLLQDHPDSSFNKIISSINIPVKTIENFISSQQIDRVKLLKIDVEGLDYDILVSLKNLLINKKVDFVKIEANRDSIEKIISFAFSNNLKIVGISSMFYFKNKLNMMDVYFENEN